MLDLLFRATHARLNWIELAGGINYFFSITLSKSLIDSLIAFWEWEERFRGWKLCCTPWTRSTPTRRSSPTSPSVPSFLTRAGVNDDLIMTILFVPQSGALSRLLFRDFRPIQLIALSVQKHSMVICGSLWYPRCYCHLRWFIGLMTMKTLVTLVSLFV